MAITIISKPQTIMPVYNPIYLNVTSNNVTADTFSYIFDTYINGSFITRNRLVNRPGDVNSIFSPATILSSYLSSDINNVFLGTASTVSDSILQYEIKVGESYINDWQFDTITKDLVSGTTKMMLSSTTRSQAYNSGDTITISGTEGAYFDGIYDVYSRINNYAVLLDVDFLSVANLVLNPSFTNTTYWELNGNWLITGGTAVCNNSNKGSLAQSNFLTVGKQYEIRMDIQSLTGTLMTYIGGGSSSAQTTTGTKYMTLTATGDDLEIFPLSGGSTVIDNVYVYRSSGLSGTTAYLDGRVNNYTGLSSNLLFNPALNYSIGGYTSFGPDGCAVTAGLVVTNKIQLNVPDVTCGSAIQTVYNTGTTLIPGATYIVSFNVDNVNSPSGEPQYVTPNLGGTLGTAFAGTGTSTQTIICGTGTTFGLKLDFSQADTGGFGAHSFSINSVSLTTDYYFSGYSFNGVLQYDEVPNWDFTDYILTSTTASFLTNMPDMEVNLTDKGNISVLNYRPYTAGEQIRVAYEINGAITYSIVEKQFMVPKTTDNMIVSIPSHPVTINQYTTAAGFGNIIGTNTKSYKIRITTTASTISETKTFTVSDGCTKYTPVQFMFLNRLGQYDYFTANLLSRETVNINRNSYRKNLNYDYSIGDRGQTIMGVDANQTYLVNTNWITEEVAAWLTEMAVSQDVYVVNSNNTLTPVILDFGSYEPKKSVNDKLINYTFTYQNANNINTQRG